MLIILYFHSKIEVSFSFKISIATVLILIYFVTYRTTKSLSFQSEFYQFPQLGVNP